VGEDKIEKINLNMMRSVIMDNEEEEEEEIENFDKNLERRDGVKEPIECPSPATLGKNIDNLIVKYKQD
jgi:hypothetical protein